MRRLRAFPAVAFAVMLAACAMTPTAVARTPTSPIQNCMTNAETDNDARRACIGSFSRACIESDDANQTTGGMVGCISSERAQWEEVRAIHLLALRERESPSQIALLEAASAEHARWAQARCAYAASIYEGGSLARVMAATCMRDTVAEHALELAGRYDEP
jgi:hypothetical protein